MRQCVLVRLYVLMCGCACVLALALFLALAFLLLLALALALLLTLIPHTIALLAGRRGGQNGCLNCGHPNNKSVAFAATRYAIVSFLSGGCPPPRAFFYLNMLFNDALVNISNFCNLYDISYIKKKPLKRV